MQEYALGLVETRGLVGSIEALDVMLKTAAVSLLSVEYVREGLVTVEVAGEVAAVQAAVAAAATAVPKVGELLSTHVIPKPADEVKSILQHRRGRTPVQPREATPPVTDTHHDDSNGVSESTDFDQTGLETMTVHQLRSLARTVEGLSIAGREISRANKQQLIHELLRLHRGP